MGDCVFTSECTPAVSGRLPAYMAAVALTMRMSDVAGVYKLGFWSRNGAGFGMFTPRSNIENRVSCCPNNILLGALAFFFIISQIYRLILTYVVMNYGIFVTLAMEFSFILATKFSYTLAPKFFSS